MIPPIEPGSDSRLVWRVVNQLLEAIKAILARLVKLETDPSRRALQPGQKDRMFPFRLYPCPVAYRQNDGADWRRFRVRAGEILLLETDGILPDNTDGVEIPDEEVIPDSMADVVIADGVPFHWFWIEISEGEGSSIVASVENSETPPANWSQTVIPIGYVDTLTFADEHRARVRQYLRTDIIMPCDIFEAEA